MSLKSWEIINCSRIITAILIFPFCSSSCCLACLPTIVRPKRSFWNLTMKKINYPEWNCSVFLSLYYLRVSRRITFFEMSYLETECFPGSISNQILLSMGTILDEERTSSLLRDFAFAFHRPTKSFASNCTASSSS